MLGVGYYTCKLVDTVTILGEGYYICKLVDTVTILGVGSSNIVLVLRVSEVWPSRGLP